MSGTSAQTAGSSAPRAAAPAAGGPVAGDPKGDGGSTAATAPSRARGRAAFGHAGRHAVMIVLSLVSIVPIYWMYAGSLRRPGDILSSNPLPWPLSLESYRYVLDTLDVPVLLFNTLMISVGTTVGQLLVCLLAAYAFAAWDFRGKGVLFLLFVATWLVPFQITMISNYLVLNQFGLLNTLAGVVVPSLCSALAVLLLRQHMQAFPRELLDAARIDGRGSWSTLWTVVVPNLRPVLASLSILLFITAWNEYFWPALVLQRANSVIQLGIRGYMAQEGNNWGAIMAASGLACLPILALYVVLQRQVIDAFVRSGLR
ncbi:carbohydrate ABC transporter permease [Frankia sp. CNm7]|uniref:Carbohydrate ABC transporter permease n=1 Tax=Frankia nepalensis TaxID=1836974 RepID=A0A937RC94_9ACTN|nr:carbohydrate ABC transporter permease [Frankia nepalensis]MBL7500459.1 carbohydrate ABC transporter permease [Frankia nepalensis]MBL7511180.1 carbohydrate ABC transporter permease [Frankia nepalensis]MBL7524451.1 carbohydrate ABC transporter permease [Frankia nepalensis]MBL7627785.1 carbohydrate ABC transporter permease [Frankia nepalensis]